MEVQCLVTKVNPNLFSKLYYSFILQCLKFKKQNFGNNMILRPMPGFKFYMYYGYVLRFYVCANNGYLEMTIFTIVSLFKISVGDLFLFHNNIETLLSKVVIKCL